MYADTVANQIVPETTLSNTAPDERKGLLQHSHDETNTPDLL